MVLEDCSVCFQARGQMGRSPQMLPHECRNLPGVDGLPGHSSHRVMPTRQPDDIEWQLMAFSFGNRVMRKIERKCQVVTRGNEAHWALAHLWQTRDKRDRTNRLPILTQLIQR